MIDILSLTSVIGPARKHVKLLEATIENSPTVDQFYVAKFKMKIDENFDIKLCEFRKDSITVSRTERKNSKYIVSKRDFNGIEERIVDMSVQYSKGCGTNLDFVLIAEASLGYKPKTYKLFIKDEKCAGQFDVIGDGVFLTNDPMRYNIIDNSYIEIDLFGLISNNVESAEIIGINTLTNYDARCGFDIKHSAYVVQTYMPAEDINIIINHKNKAKTETSEEKMPDEDSSTDTSEMNEEEESNMEPSKNNNGVIDIFTIPEEMAKELSELLQKQAVRERLMEKLIGIDNARYEAAEAGLLPILSKIDTIKQKITTELVPSQYRDPKYMWNYDGYEVSGNTLQILKS